MKIDFDLTFLRKQLDFTDQALFENLLLFTKSNLLVKSFDIDEFKFRYSFYIEKLLPFLLKLNHQNLGKLEGDVIKLENAKLKETLKFCVYLLNYRFVIVQAIGDYKKANAIAILDSTRWQDKLNEMVQLASNHSIASPAFADFWNEIHKQSCLLQGAV